MSEQYDGLPEYNLGEPEDIAFIRATVPEACHTCPVLHDLVVDYIKASMERARSLTMGEHMMSERMEQLRHEVLEQQRLAMEEQGVHISKQDIERLADQFDQEKRRDIAELIDRQDKEVDVLRNTITIVPIYCDGPMKIGASRHGIAHTALICTSLMENIRSNSAIIKHGVVEG